MKYSASFDILNSQFNQKDPEILINELGIHVKNFTFHSNKLRIEHQPEVVRNDNHLYDIPDQHIGVNNNFTYSIFFNKNDRKRHRQVILMLHGLNERKWAKYLPWAASLVHKTGIPVVLFPISFHMNRSPEDWSNPRLLMPIVKNEISAGTFDETTTIANFTLSKRLGEAPERFFLSGHQSINDVNTLIKGWKNNENPMIHPEVRVDFFSYSIGAFLSQILLIANPDKMLNDSRFFLFCGGSLFSEMNAISKFIMNKSSFDKIHQYYTEELETTAVQKGKYADLLNFDSFGRAFRAMIIPEKFQQLRTKAFEEFQNQLKAIGLKKDAVITAHAISDLLSKSIRQPNSCYEEWDFEYPYSHENPFDHKLTKFREVIDDEFDRLMGNASSFFLAR